VSEFRKFVPAEFVRAKKDLVCRNILTDKIVFVKNSIKPPYPAYYVVKIDREYDKYDIGTAVLCGNYNEIYGELKELLMRTLKDVDANKCELVKVVKPEGRRVKTLGLGIYYKLSILGNVYRHYLDAVDFAQKAEIIRPIIEYNEEIREINKKIEDTIESLDKNPSTALLPADWDFEKSTWKESGKTKIQKRNERAQSLARQIPEHPEPEEVRIKGWTVVEGFLVNCVYSEPMHIISYTIYQPKPPEYLSKYFTNIDEVLEKHGTKVEGGYIIKYFPIPIYSGVWSDDYGAPVTSGIHRGSWSGEDYLYFREKIAFNRKAYEVYPAIIAESKEKAMERAEKIAGGDGTVEDVTVQQVSDNVWIIKWRVFD